MAECPELTRDARNPARCRSEEEEEEEEEDTAVEVLVVYGAGRRSVTPRADRAFFANTRR
jgi:hypothetical protein